MDRKRGNDKIADFEDNYYSIGGSGVDILICGVDQDIFICNQVNNKVNIKWHFSTKIINAMRKN